MSSLKQANVASDTLIEQGQRIYDERLQAQLEPTQTGRFVAIEPITEHYFLGDTSTAALLVARAAMPDSLFYLMRVGQQTAHTVGGHVASVG